MPLLFVPWGCKECAALPESAVLEVVAMGKQTCQAEKLFEAPL